MTTAVATKEKPPKTFLEMITSDAMVKDAMEAAPGFMDPIRLFRIAQTIYRGNSKLQRCTDISLMASIAVKRMALMGSEIGSSGLTVFEQVDENGMFSGVRVASVQG